MNFKVSTAKEALSTFGESSFIAASGIYDVTIKFASVDVSKGGAESVNFNVDYNGNDVTLYGPYVTNKDGATNEIGAKLINSLAVIAGMGNGQSFTTEEESHTVGKDKKEQTFTVITDFSDLPVKVWLQLEYSRNPETQDIKERKVIKAFYRAADDADAAEIASNTSIGKRLAIVQEKYASNITYKDVTPEEVAQWKANKAANKAAPAKPMPKAAAKPSTSLFK